MNILEKNQTITPHRISLCILLHEVLMNTQIPHTVLIKVLKFLTNQVIFEKEDMSLGELLDSLRVIDEPDYSISERMLQSLNSITNYSDLLSLFLVKLEELKNDGDIPSGLLEQGGALFGFIIKNFITFTRMGFEDLTRLEKRLQAYKSAIQDQREPSASSIANNLPSLFTSEPYEALKAKIEKLEGGDKYIILSHLDAAYGKSSAIDHAHRYFDTVLDKYMPTKTTKERGLVVVHSSTHFASMHRVKVELEVGHLDVAVHLLVETIKRALSENDNAAILESTLLFMQIAAIIGNFRQEERIAVKAVLHSIQMGSTVGLIKSCLSYLNLELVYNLPNSEQILRAITPAPTPKKMNAVQKRTLECNPSVRASVNLASYTALESIKNQQFSEFLPKLLEIKTLLWKDFSPWLSDCHSVLLKNIAGDSIRKYPDCNYYLKRVRLSAYQNKAQALSMLKEVDEACVVKDVTDWTFTVCYLNAVWGTHLGLFKEAEYFETQALAHIKPLSAPESTTLIELARAERLLFQGSYVKAYQLLYSLLNDCKQRQLFQEAGRCAVLLASVYSNVQECVRAYYLLREALEFGGKGDVQLLLEIKMSEVLLDLYPFSSACLDSLAKVEEEIALSQSVYTLGRYHLVKGKGLVGAASKLDSEISQKVIRKAVSHIEEATSKFKELQFVWETRECYYLLARTYDMMAEIALRDEAASAYCRCNKELNLAEKKCWASEAGSLTLLT